jgi:hypothetical protein
MGNGRCYHDDDIVRSAFQIWHDVRPMQYELIAPEWSEYRIERQVHHVWHCPKYNACFGSLVVFPADTKSMRDIKTGKIIFPSLFPSLLVA